MSEHISGLNAIVQSRGNGSGYPRGEAHVEKKALMWWRRRASDSGNRKLRWRWRVPRRLAPEIEAFNQANDILRDFQDGYQTAPPEQSATRPNYSLLRAQVKLEIRVSYERVCFKACVAEPGACLRYLHGNFA